MRTWIAACAAGLLVTPAALAQVNVEPLRKKLREDGYSGALEASLTGRLGNNEALLGSGVGQVGFGSRHHLGFVHARGDYTQINRKTLIARSFVHARYNLTLLDDLLWAEVFAQTQSDAFLLLRHRELYGIGPRVALASSSDVQLVGGVAAMFEHERVAVPQGAPDPAVTNVFRASSYLALTFTSDPRVTFSTTAFLQPRIDRPGDYRLYVESFLDFVLRKNLSVRIYGAVRYDSEPVTGVKTTDLELRDAITFSF